MPGFVFRACDSLFDGVRMKRRHFLQSLCGAGALRAQTGGVRNIVLILADDLGWADTTPYGADLHETPNLERLAREGTLFRRAYAASPVCTPTRASILTGKHPARLGMTIWRESARTPPRNRKLLPPLVGEDLPHTERTLSRTLHDHGWFTAHVGKWHLGGAAHYPETHGFDVNIGGTLWGAPQTFFAPYSGNKYYGGEFRYVPGLAPAPPGEYLTDRLTSEALRILETKREKPLFLNLWFHTVHTPIEGKTALVERYRRKLKPGLRHQNPEYAAMVHSLDENVGRVLDAIDSHGMRDSTAVVFLSDNGGYINPWQGASPTTNAPLRSGKGSLYEGGIRIPLMVRAPGVRRGGVCEEPVCTTDLCGTLLSLAGLEADARSATGQDGLNLRPLVENPRAQLGRSELFFHYPHYYPTTTPVSAIVARHLKLIHYYEDGRDELYDVAADPGESSDLSARLPDETMALKRRLMDWLNAVKAPMAAPNPNAA